MNTCEHCIYLHSHRREATSGILGKKVYLYDLQCHRYPPVPFGSTGTCHFPPVKLNDFCGEFQGKAVSPDGTPVIAERPTQTGTVP